MCGIAGYVGRARLSVDAIDETLQGMRLRGPDSQNSTRIALANQREVTLLHSRLNIIDLDARSNQPIDMGPFTLIYNGEIYNYRELRIELESNGRVFLTQSDTEVLLQAWDAWGEAALDKFEGMWAFALLNRDSGELVLCRDRFGEKPLYVMETVDGLYFASEVKFLFSLSGTTPSINWKHLYRYLVNGYKSLYKEQNAFFQAISEIVPGTLKVVDAAGRASERRYWVPSHAPEPSMTFAQAVAGVRERLIEAVGLRLRSDVPLAFAMSGGVDSVSLISIAKKIFDYDVHGFTIVNKDERYDERELIDSARDSLGISHTAIPINTDDFLGRMRTLVAHHDAPVYTISYFAHWLLQKAVAEHGYKVSISGTAADELFSGYYDHHLFYLHAIQDDPALLQTSTNNWLEHVKPIVRNPFLTDPRAFIDNPSTRDHIFLDAAEFGKFIREPWGEQFSESLYTSSLMRNRMMNELFHEVIPVILHEDDLNSMFFSIENRSPFLDRNLFEFAASIPDEHLIREGRAKAVLREAMRGIAPDEIIDNRRKVGFNAPIGDFLDRRDPGVREQVMAESPIFDHVRRDKIEELLNAETLPNSKSKFLFYFISSKFFTEAYAV